MADLRRKQLPNLKISVDNTESTDDSSDEVEVRDEVEISLQDDDVVKSEESEEEEEIDKDEVEFNVRIGSSSFSDPKIKQERDHHDHSSTAKKSESAIQDVNTSIPPSKRPSQAPDKRVYENKQGGFVTGIDITSKEAEKKRQERARRFRIQQERDEQFSVDVKALYNSLGVKKDDFENEEKGLRESAVHLRGTDDMSTKDVFEYFTQFPASEIEWINDTSCNVLWHDKMTCVRALLNVSTSYQDAVAEESKKRKEEEEKEEQGKKKKEEKKKQRKKKESRDKEMQAVEDQSKAPETAAGSGDGTKPGEEEEKMEVDDDDLDLMVENEAVDVSKADSAVDAGKEKTSPPTALGEAKPGKERTVKKKEKDKGKKSKDGETAASRKKDKTEDDKEEKKKKKKKGAAAEKEKGEESDSSSSSSSSSSGSSSGSSSSDSDSSSGSDSDSSSSSDSESDKEKKKKKKKKSHKGKREADTGEVLRQRRKGHSIPWPPGKWRLGVPCKKARYLFLRFATKYDKKELGAEKKSHYYRKYGNPNFGGMKGLISGSRKRKILLAKFDKEVKSQGPDAREAIDKKRADRRRQQRGVDREEGELSTEELMDHGEEEEEDHLHHLSEEEEEEGAEPPAPFFAEKPKDLRQLLNRDPGGAQASRRPNKPSLDKVVLGKRSRGRDEDDEEELDLDAELEQLMEPRPPAKKRMMMRMHADDEEERIKAKKVHKGRGLLTVVASPTNKGTGGVRSRLAGRLGGRLQLPAVPPARRGADDNRYGGYDEGGVRSSEARLPHSEDDDDDEEEAEEEMDDFTRELESYRTLRNLPPFKPSRVAASKVTGAKKSTTSSLVSDSMSVGDGGGGGGGGGAAVQSRLGAPKAGKDSDKRSFPSMRIEVFDDGDDEGGVDDYDDDDDE